jgi:hypothetical protein
VPLILSFGNSNILRHRAAGEARPASPQHLVHTAAHGGPVAGALPGVPRRPGGRVVEWERVQAQGEGARLAGLRCNLRSELGDRFYTGAPMVKLQMNGAFAFLKLKSMCTFATSGTRCCSCKGARLPILGGIRRAQNSLQPWWWRRRVV